jgi:hypothetical protein
MRVLTFEEAQQADDMALAVCLGETRAGLEHLTATHQGTPLDHAQLLTTLSNAGIVWAQRHDMMGATLGVVLDHARAWATERPAALADYDQRRAAFRTWVTGGPE